MKLENIQKPMERTKDGVIKDFSVRDAHHLYVQVIHISSNEMVRKEAIALEEPAELDKMHLMQDADDPGVSLKQKWALSDDVIKALKENGDCIQMIPAISPVFRFEYFLKPMRFADQLKHKG